MPVNFEEVHHLTEAEEAKAHSAADALAQQATSDLCVSCGETVPLDTVDAYTHEYGWFLVPGLQRQWLSIRCPHCGYDISLEKLGVPR